MDLGKEIAKTNNLKENINKVIEKTNINLLEIGANKVNSLLSIPKEIDKIKISKKKCATGAIALKRTTSNTIRVNLNLSFTPIKIVVNLNPSVSILGRRGINIDSEKRLFVSNNSTNRTATLTIIDMSNNGFTIEYKSNNDTFDNVDFKIDWIALG